MGYRELAWKIVVRALRDWKYGRQRPPYLADLGEWCGRPYYTADAELLEFFYSEWGEMMFDLAYLDIREIMAGLGIPYRSEIWAGA